MMSHFFRASNEICMEKQIKRIPCNYFTIVVIYLVILGLEAQHCYEALGDLWVKILEKAVLNIELVRLSPREWPKVGCL